MDQVLNTSSCVGSFRFGVLNTSHAKSSCILINQDLYRLGIDILCVNEPYYNKCGLAYFLLAYEQIAVTDKPRVAIIIVNHNIKYTILVKERDFIIMMMKMGNRDYLLINTYAPPSADFYEVINKLEYYFIKYSESKIIITGDLKAKHYIWGNDNTDNRGFILVKLINKYQVSILNHRNSSPTYLSTLGQSWIDLVLFKNMSNTGINHYKLDEILLSDHKLITFSLKIKKGKENKKGKRK